MRASERCRGSKRSSGMAIYRRTRIIGFCVADVKVLDRFRSCRPLQMTGKFYTFASSGRDRAPARATVGGGVPVPFFRLRDRLTFPPWPTAASLRSRTVGFPESGSDLGMSAHRLPEARKLDTGALTTVFPPRLCYSPAKVVRARALTAEPNLELFKRSRVIDTSTSGTVVCHDTLHLGAGGSKVHTQLTQYSP